MVWMKQTVKNMMWDVRTVSCKAWLTEKDFYTYFLHCLIEEDRWNGVWEMWRPTEKAQLNEERYIHLLPFMVCEKQTDETGCERCDEKYAKPRRLIKDIATYWLLWLEWSRQLKTGCEICELHQAKLGRLKRIYTLTCCYCLRIEDR